MEFRGDVGKAIQKYFTSIKTVAIAINPLMDDIRDSRGEVRV